MITNDVGHLVFVAPILGEESGVVLQNLWTTKSVIQAAESEHGRTDQVQNTNNKEGVEVGHLSARTNAIAKRGYVWEQDQALLIHRLIEGEVTHFEQHHGASPEHHQTSVGHVGT